MEENIRLKSKQQIDFEQGKGLSLDSDVYIYIFWLQARNHHYIC